jgi:hypothetical protein
MIPQSHRPHWQARWHWQSCESSQSQLLSIVTIASMMLLLSVAAGQSSMTKSTASFDLRSFAALDQVGSHAAELLGVAVDAAFGPLGKTSMSPADTAAIQTPPSRDEHSDNSVQFFGRSGVGGAVGACGVGLAVEASRITVRPEQNCREVAAESNQAFQLIAKIEIDSDSSLIICCPHHSTVPMRQRSRDAGGVPAASQHDADMARRQFVDSDRRTEML